MHMVSSYLTVGARPSKDVRMINTSSSIINTSSSASESNTIFQTLLASNDQMVRAADTAIKLLLAPLSLVIRATGDDNQAVNDEHYRKDIVAMSMIIIWSKKVFWGRYN